MNRYSYLSNKDIDDLIARETQKVWEFAWQAGFESAQGIYEMFQDLDTSGDTAFDEDLDETE